ncbi:MAG: PKD domain-containing protein [Candidatus Methanospirare jalkutatii]|nr:MAG: PKD domain-containing protein [Candidatus Methanospirare jalkutatii]
MNKIWKIRCLVAGLIVLLVGVGIATIALYGPQKTPLEQDIAMESMEYPRFFKEFNLSIKGKPLLYRPVELICRVTQTPYASGNISIEVILPEGFELISGNLSWHGYLAANKTIEVKSIIRAIKVGNWTITAKTRPFQATNLYVHVGKKSSIVYKTFPGPAFFGFPASAGLKRIHPQKELLLNITTENESGGSTDNPLTFIEKTIINATKMKKTIQTGNASAINMSEYSENVQAQYESLGATKRHKEVIFAEELPAKVMNISSKEEEVLKRRNVANITSGSASAWIYDMYVTSVSDSDGDGYYEEFYLYIDADTWEDSMDVYVEIYSSTGDAWYTNPWTIHGLEIDPVYIPFWMSDFTTGDWGGDNIQPTTVTLTVDLYEYYSGTYQDTDTEDVPIETPTIDYWYITPTSVNPGGCFTAYYKITNPSSNSYDAWLGLSIRDPNDNVINDPDNDKEVTLQPGTHWYSREFTVPSDATTGLYDIALGLHGGRIGNSVAWYYTGWQNDELEVIQEEEKYYLKVINNDPDSFYVYFDMDDNHDWNPDEYPYYLSVDGYSTAYSANIEAATGWHTVYIMWFDCDYCEWQHQELLLYIDDGETQEYAFTLPWCENIIESVSFDPDPPITVVPGAEINIDVIVSLTTCRDGVLQVWIYDADLNIDKKDWVYIPYSQSTTRTLNLDFDAPITSGTYECEVYTQFVPGATSGPIDYCSICEVNQIDSYTINVELLRYSVKGYFVYTDDHGEERPVRYARVELYDNEPYPLPPELLQTTHTDANGYYEFDPIDNNDGFLEGGRDIFVVVYADTDAVRVTDGSSVYSHPTEIVDNVGPDDITGGYLDMGKINVDNDGAFNIYNTTIDEYQWLNERVDWTREQIEVRWPYGGWPQHVYIYNTLTGAIIEEWIEVPNGWEWDRHTPLHEYAHGIMLAAYGYNHFNMPPAGNYNGHWIYMESDPGFAFIEGWAEFMECAIDNDKDYSFNTSETIESNDWADYESFGNWDGSIVEGAVASILWDIFDPSDPNDNCEDGFFDDGISLGDGISNEFNKLWEIILKDNPKDIDDFWNHWFSTSDETPTNFGQKYELKAIYFEHRIDKNSKPVCSISQPADWISGTYTIPATASDTDPEDPLKVSFYYSTKSSEGPWNYIGSDSTPSGNEYSVAWDTDNILDDQVWLKAVASDGMESCESISSAFGVDNAKPDSEIVYPEDGKAYNKSTIKTHFWANDVTVGREWSGVAYLYYKMDTDPWKKISYSGGAVNVNYTLSDGRHTFYVKAEDKAGNVEESESVTFIIDTTPPTISIISPTDGQVFTTATITVSGTVSDNIDLSKVEVKVGSGSWQTATISGTTWSKQVTLAPGPNTIYARAIDEAGNTNEISVTVTYNRPPNRPSNPSPSDGATNVPIDTSLSWSCSDPDGDTLKYDIYLGTSIPPPLVKSDHTSTTYDPILENNTTYYWKVVAKDGYAETEGDIWSFTTVSPDTTPPETEIIEGPSGKINYSDVRFVWTGTDDRTPTSELVYAYKLEGYDADWSWTSDTSKNYSLPNGNYTFKVKAKDKAGNVDPTPAERTFTVSVENQPPVASFTYSPQHPKVNENITFNASLSYDPDGTIVEYEWDFGDGNITSTTEEIIKHFYSETGIYEVTLTVTDDEGATNSTTKEITVQPASEANISFNPSRSIIGVGLTAEINLILDKAQNGLSGYNITVSLSNATVAEITSVSFPDWATLHSNSTLPADSLWIKATDLYDKIKSGAKNITLATITLRGDKQGESDILITVTKMDDDNENPIDPNTVSGKIEVIEVVPFPGCENPPTDPDGDGLYEDINGNGRKDFNDVVVFFNYLEWVEENQPCIECFDFNKNGRIDFDDVVKLFEEI